ncbi:RNase H-like domain found in reverse transcriptase [Popillia japonica]|uniref:RNA-directed DNA polymerase n=1 Tax=Popillia japonica TaxID=7064 RepID=A0AAW1LAS1_POPJA
MCKTKNKTGNRKARKAVNAVQESSEETESTEDEGIGTLSQFKYEIKIDENTNPYSISTPRRVPILLLPKVEEELRKMVDQDIIEEVGVNNPSLWCAPMSDDDNIKAVTEFPEPKRITDIRRFLGMINHLTKFVDNVAEESKPLRELLKQNNVFCFSDEYEKCFKKLKSLITAPVLKLYDVNKETRILADSSSYGIGGCLEQRQENGHWAPVLYCPKSLSDAQQRYVQIEKEALAIVWVCERLQEYLIGKRFVIQTDHLPLLTMYIKEQEY